ncbi:anti-sigma factor family protein [Streptomyces sp. NPDC056653]|uniref:anti-sigma factor family protein n=1 Tax=Streptomyces sp. NPDC056653 TaxID=3345894 RepID=UPI00367F8E83
MTSTTDTTQHPDVSEISDLTEGVLPPSRTAEVRRHVNECGICGEVLNSLEKIRGLLGTLPDPERMPDDIADRIDAALAAEPLRSSDHAADVSRETEAVVGHDQEAGDQDSGGQETRGRETQPALADRPTGHPRATTGPGRRPARRRHRGIVLGTALGAAMVGVSVLMLQTVQNSPDSAGASKATAADSGVSAPEDGVNAFSGSPLSRHVEALLNGTGMPASGESDEKRAPSVEMQSTPDTESPTPSSPKTPLRTPAVTVPACIQQGIGRRTAALAIEEGTYEGTHAYLVVLPHQTNAALVQAYVMDASCVDADPTGKGKLLLTHSYARP